MPANPGTDRAVHELTPPSARHPLTSCRPLPGLVPSRLIPLTSLGPTSRKRTDQPTAASRRLFRGAEHAPPPRKEKERQGYICGARNRKMAANLFWEGEGRVLRERCTTAPRGCTRACAWNSYAVQCEKGGIYRRDRIIGDSLFLLALPTHRLF